MPLEIIRNDITNMCVDAIVNTANPVPRIGSGTDAAIHAKAGPALLEERKRIGIIDTGEAVLTAGYDLPADYVIHTVGPVWNDGAHGEALLLRRCYENSLKLARTMGLKTVAFPLISSGNYGFPKQLALQIATETIGEFLRTYELHVYLVVFSKESFEISRALRHSIESFIDDHYVEERTRAEYSFSVSKSFEEVRRLLEEPTEPMEIPDERDTFTFNASAPEELISDSWAVRGAALVLEEDRETLPAMNLADWLKRQDIGFSEKLLALIDQSGRKDSEVYKRANVDRKLFSKIRSNPAYKPSKTTALAFAIALELNLEQTQDLIGRAGYTLTSSSELDLIVMYFIVHGQYNIHDINAALFEFDHSILGAS